LRYIQKEI